MYTPATVTASLTTARRSSSVAAMQLKNLDLGRRCDNNKVLFLSSANPPSKFTTEASPEAIEFQNYVFALAQQVQSQAGKPPAAVAAAAAAPVKQQQYVFGLAEQVQREAQHGGDLVLIQEAMVYIRRELGASDKITLTSKKELLCGGQRMHLENIDTTRRRDNGKVLFLSLASPMLRFTTAATATAVMFQDCVFGLAQQAQREAGMPSSSA
jgi:hypothetical protein